MIRSTDNNATDGSASPKASIRPCRDQEIELMLAIINEAAEAYRGVIPAECWHEPYMTAEELRSEIEAGIVFTAYEIDGEVAGVMGIQPVHNVDLIRHAYVRTTYQGQGVGSALIAHLRAGTSRPILVGTWTAATWAIGFYQRHDFQLVPESTKAALLRTYWTVSERQIETSVVLATPQLTHEDARTLMDLAKAV